MSMFNPDSNKITSGRDTSYRSSDVKGRPSADPDSKKDFKKILSKDSGDEDENQAAKEIIEETDGTAPAGLEEGKKKAPPSLFDLTSGKKATGFDDKPARAMESPASIYGKLTADAKGAKTAGSRNTQIEDSEDVVVVPEKETYTTRFSTEQTDLSYINPLAAVTNTQPSVNLNISTEKAVVPVSNIQEIINQMVEKITEMKNTGSTETMVTLKHPPIFEGARIVITDFDSAKNEFNITIENLTQQGKNLMDQRGNRDSLLLALENKGYAVHILTTTTVVENRLVDVLPQEDQSDRQRRGEEREGQGQQQRRGKEDQT